jgi:alpha-N-arabinofuranosidase
MLKDNMDAKYLSTRVAGGFVGCLYAMYATSLGKPSTTVSCFDWFEYQGKDDIYERYSEK